MLDIVIRGGQVVTPDGVGTWDVAIQGERIVAVAAPGVLTGDVGGVIDATNKIVIPGGIDPHVHTAWWQPGPGTKAMFMAPPKQVSYAALFGGTTTLVDFAPCEQGQTLSEAIARTEDLWGESYTDYALHVMLRGTLSPEIVAQVPETISAGYPSFKLFTTDIWPNREGLMVHMGHIWAMMEATARHGGVLAVHAEDDDIVDYMHEKLEREGRLGYEYMPLAHNIISEDLSFRRIIRLARYVEGATLYMVHVSAKVGVDAIAEARADGFPIYGETLHHYTAFTAEAYMRPDGVIFHTYPSLKYEEDRQRIWAGLRDGGLSTVATDEVCTPRAVKVEGRTIFDAVGGHVGVETRVAIIYTEGVAKRGLSLERFVAATSSNAAKILGLYPRKGAIAPGSDADVVVFDPNIRRTLRVEDLHDTDYSIWEGWEVHGWPEIVVLRGQVAVEHGRFTSTGPGGQRVRRKLTAAIQGGPAV